MKRFKVRVSPAATPAAEKWFINGGYTLWVLSGGVISSFEPQPFEIDYFGFLKFLDKASRIEGFFDSWGTAEPTPFRWVSCAISIASNLRPCEKIGAFYTAINPKEV